MKIFFNNSAEHNKETLALVRKAMQTTARLVKLKPAVQVSVTLSDEAGMKELNRQWRGIDKVTDVISFALNEGEQEQIIGGPQEELLGEIVICLPQAARQAAEYRHSLPREVGYLAVHGLLHLLGYDHRTTARKQLMRAIEEDVLRKLELSER